MHWQCSTGTFENTSGCTALDMPMRADRLVGKAVTASGLRLGRSEVLRSLRYYLRAQSQGQGHHTIDRLEERGVGRRSSLKGRERAIVIQKNIKTVLNATLGKI